MHSEDAYMAWSKSSREISDVFIVVGGATGNPVYEDAIFTTVGDSFEYVSEFIGKDYETMQMWYKHWCLSILWEGFKDLLCDMQRTFRE